MFGTTPTQRGLLFLVVSLGVPGVVPKELGIRGRTVPINAILAGK